MLRSFLIFGLLVGTCLATDKWVWSKERHFDDRQDRGILDQSRYDNFRTSYEFERLREREREPTTRRPNRRPTQSNDEYDDYDTDDRNQQQQQQSFNRFGQPYGPFPVGSQQNYYPNAANGILVGPGGPTGIIGRPANYREQISGGFNLRPNPANGILVGPGGPTGILGRPPRPNGFFNNPGQYPTTGPLAVGPQVFPGQGGGNGQNPNPTGQGLQGNFGFVAPPGYPSGIGGGFPGGNYQLGGGYPLGYPGGIGGGIYPSGAQGNGYGFLPSQYIPNSLFGTGYNNDIDDNGDNNYSSAYKVRSNIQFKDEPIRVTSDTIAIGGSDGDNRNIIKKSVNNKLSKI